MASSNTSAASTSSSSSSSPSISIAAVPALIEALPASHPLSLSSATVFVTGASGFVGRWLIRSLLSPALAVKTIRCVVRSDDAEKIIRTTYDDAVKSQRAANAAANLTALATLEIVHAGLDEEEKLQKGLEGVRHAIHLAATTDDWDPKKVSEKINVGGTKTLLKAAKAAGVRRFVHCGTEAALVGGGPIVNADETRALVPASSTFPYSRSKALAELAVLAANDGDAFSTVSIRPRFVWGHGDTNVLSKLAEVVRKGDWVWVGGGTALTSSCHVLNLCEGLLLGAERGVGGSSYFVTDGAPHQTKAIMSSLLAAVDVKVGDKSLPYSLAYAAAAVSETWCGWFGGRPSITRQILALVAEEVTVKDDKARKELGYKGKVSVEEGMKQLKEHFQKFHTLKDY